MANRPITVSLQKKNGQEAPKDVFSGFFGVKQYGQDIR